MNEQKIQHLIVLMLENRSFDHLLGYLEYPPEVAFEGVRGRELEMGNPVSDGRDVFPSPNANYLINPGPNHGHDSVMSQLLGPDERSFPYPLTNDGFAADYETINPGRGDLALQCFLPDRVPVLSELAKEFAVCDHWFCSVPGDTWPNRNFAHAATSDGEVSIRLRPYINKTIFEQLSEANRHWGVYYGGFPPLTMNFTRLWASPERNWLQHFKPVRNLYRAIRQDRLPHYAFVEPDILGKTSDSQHPGMGGGEMDFRSAERLIWRIYTALRDNMAVFKKTLFLITYDEHGGFFDHVPPPQGPEWSVEPWYREEGTGYTFKFDLLGPRVPAVLVSPWIAPDTVDNTIYDHASIPATVRKLFHISEGLTARDKHANTFDAVLNLEKPREQLPELEEPLVDGTARRLAEGLELREGLSWILREMIWDQILGSFRIRPGPLMRGGDLDWGGGDTPDLETEITREIVEELGPRLSSEAQQVLSGEEMREPVESAEPTRSFDPLAADSSPSAPALRGSPNRIVTAVKIVRHKLEMLLENSSLADDAMILADYFLRKVLEDRSVTLRTAGGLSFDHPEDATLRAAIEALFTRRDNFSNAWLADHKDRWLTVYSDGRAIFHDQDPQGVFFIEHVDRQLALQLFNRMKEGDLSTIRRTFGQSGTNIQTMRIA